MNINLPPRVRQVIYILAAVSQPVMLFLLDNARVNDFQYGLFTVVMVAVTSLAAVNVDTNIR